MPVLILSRNVAIYSTRRLTEAFRSLGRTTRVLDPAAVSLSLADEGARLSVSGDPLEPPEAVVPRIGFGIADHSVVLLRHLEAAGVPMTASARAVRISGDKIAGLQVLAAAGLPVPDTVLVRRPEDADWAITEVGGPPVVLKFLAGTHGVGVFLADSRESARTILDAMLGIDRPLLVQRFIESSAGSDLRLFVVGDRVVATIRRRAAQGSFRANLHSGGRAEAIAPDPDLVELALRATRAIGLHVAGVDLLESDSGPLVAEVNSSPGLEGIEETTGVDVATEIAEEALRLAGTL